MSCNHKIFVVYKGVPNPAKMEMKLISGDIDLLNEVIKLDIFKGGQLIKTLTLEEGITVTADTITFDLQMENVAVGTYNANLYFSSFSQKDLIIEVK